MSVVYRVLYVKHLYFSYIINVGIVDKLTQYFRGVQGPIDEDRDGAEFLQHSLGLLVAMTKFMSKKYVVFSFYEHHFLFCISPDLVLIKCFWAPSPNKCYLPCFVHLWYHCKHVSTLPSVCQSISYKPNKTSLMWESIGSCCRHCQGLMIQFTQFTVVLYADVIIQLHEYVHVALWTRIFMPPDRMIGGILFLSCLFVCLLSTFAVTFEP